MKSICDRHQRAFETKDGCPYCVPAKAEPSTAMALTTTSVLRAVAPLGTTPAVLMCDAHKGAPATHVWSVSGLDYRMCHECHARSLVVNPSPRQWTIAAIAAGGTP